MKHTNVLTGVTAGSTALHAAAKGGFARCVRVLLEGHADTEARDNDGKTVLHVASAGNQITVISQLAEAHCNLLSKDHAGNTALHTAAESGSKEVVQYLVQEYQLATEDLNSAKLTPTDLAKQHGHQEIVGWLEKQLPSAEGTPTMVLMVSVC